MDKYIVLHIVCSIINNNQGFKDSLVARSEKCFLKRSDLAVETFEVIMTLAEFAVAIIALPYIAQFIDRNKITVSFEGYELSDNWKRVIKQICKNPDAKSVFVQALHDHDISVSGNSKNVISFYTEVKQILKELDKQHEVDDTDD